MCPDMTQIGRGREEGEGVLVDKNIQCVLVH